MACAPCEIWVMSVLHDRPLQEDVEIPCQKVRGRRPVSRCPPVELIEARECLEYVVSNVEGNYVRS